MVPTDTDQNWLRITCLLLCIGCSSGCWNSDSSPPKNNLQTKTKKDSEKKPLNASKSITVAEKLFSEGKIDRAFELLSQQLIKSPEDNRLLLLASQVAAAQGDRSRAIELAESVAKESPQYSEATDVLVQEYVKDRRPAQAVERLIAAIEQTSGSSSRKAIWRQQAWELLNRLGRRQEASAQADELCRAGNLNRAILISLLRRNESFPITLEEGDSPEKRFYSGSGMARWYFSQDKFNEALDQLAKENETVFSSAAARALYGRLLAETQTSPESFAHWFAKCNDDTKSLSDYWIALGIYFFDRQQIEASARALLNGVMIDPTDDDGFHRLARVLGALNRNDDAAAMREHAIRVALLRSVVQKLSLTKPRPELTDDLPEKLLSLGRPFESIGWALVDLDPANAEKKRGLLAQRQLLSQKPEVREMPSEVARMDLDANEFPIENAIEELTDLTATSRDSNDGDASDFAKPMPLEPDFENIADLVGVDFQYYHADKINLKSIPLHEMMGGGIGVLDFDLDGWPDVYFAQGSGEPPDGRSTRPNELRRNTGRQFVDVTVAAKADDFHYSTGIAAGDVNQDGFPDLFLGALGDNRLLINNGDGTFRDATNFLKSPAPRFTSSVAVADLTGDSIPELFECVYVEMADGFRLPDRDKNGDEMVPNPNDFYADADRWYLATENGRFESQEIDRKRIEPGTALGVAITDMDGDGRNDVFVSNDARPNHWLNGFDRSTVNDVALLKGVAFGFRGFSNACMGIATGDFDRDGRFDIHVTNYANEPNNHFLQGKSGVFSDYATRFDLHDTSDPHVGFGVKAVDINRDGWLDLFVSNGHVFDDSKHGKPFRMPPQIISNQQSRFEICSVHDSSDYFENRYVGRSVAKVDFDVDRDIDFFVGHLDTPVALLRNQTQSSGDYLQLELVGFECGRDAIGTRVEVNLTNGRLIEWVTAGDGYLCSDEPVLDFGLGKNAQIESIEVHWISGRSQVFDAASVNKRYLIVQGIDELWAR